MPLSQFIVIKSNANGKYLQYGQRISSTPGQRISSTPSSLNFSHQMKRPNLDVEEETLESVKNRTTLSNESLTEFHHIKFKVEEAKDAPGFVHIRTCYNNKYLARESEESKNIVAEAHEAEEDQLKWSCTLFKPVFLGEAEEDEEDEGCRLFGNKHGIGMTPHKIQLVHAMSQDNVYVDTETGSMRLTSTDATILTISDVAATAILPKYFALRGHDGLFLGTTNGADLNFRFNDLADAAVATVTLNDWLDPAPNVLYSHNFQGYWRLNHNNDVGVSVLGASDFAPVKVNNHVALYVLDNNKFLSRTSNNGVTAESTTIIEEARFEVVETILSRTILSITYDLANARVYDTTSVTKITDSRSNYTDEHETGTLEKDFTMSRTMSWNQSLMVSVGMSMGMSFGLPTVGLGAEVSINFSVSQTVVWDEKKEETETIKHSYSFDVPPMTKQVKTVVASRSSCDVPFTCEVEDLMTNGTIMSYTKTGCWFAGANDYNVTQETHNYPLTD